MQKKKITKIAALVAVALILLVAAVIAVILLARNLIAGGSVAFLSDVRGLKSAYYVGDEIEVSGTMRATYKDGRTEVVEITGDMVEGFDSSEPGKVDVTISYKDASLSVPLTFTPQGVISLSLDESTRPAVVYSGGVFPAGMYVDAVMLDDSVRHIPVTNQMIKGYDSLTLGTQRVTVTYMNASVSFDVEVRADEIDRVEVVSDKKIYHFYEEFAWDEVFLLLVYKSGMTRTIKVSEEMLDLSAFRTDIYGDYSIEITYDGGETLFSGVYHYNVE